MYPHRASQSLRQQRMSLQEFIVSISFYIDSILVVHSASEIIIMSCCSDSDKYSLEYKNATNKLEELEVHINAFHDSIEFSTYLPLAVVPFLLPLLVALKKAQVEMACIKQSLSEPVLQVEGYGQIREKATALKDLCESIVSQSRFVLHKAKFREKSMAKIHHFL